MSRTVQQRLAALENLEKSLKSTFPVAGSLVKFVVTKSQYFRIVTQANETITARFRFTPSKSLGQNNLITLAAETVSTKYPCLYYVSPQNGDGSLVLTMTIPGQLMETTTREVQITALGTVSGTFERVA